MTTPVHPATVSTSTKLWAAGLAFFLLAIGGVVALEIQRYRSLPTVCREAVLAEVHKRMSRVDEAVAVASKTIAASASLTDVRLDEPVYDGPFKATVPARFSVQVSAWIMSQERAVPLECDATFTGWWQVTVVDAG